MTKTLVEQLVWKNLLDSGDHKLTLFNRINLAMYSSYPWVMVLQRVGEKKGIKYLFDLGLLMGECSAKEVIDVLNKDSKRIPNDLQTFENVVEMLGFGIVRKTEKQKKIKINIEKNNIILYSFEKHGSKGLAIHFYAGVFSGILRVLEKNKKIILIIDKGYEQYNSQKEPLCSYKQEK